MRVALVMLLTLSFPAVAGAETHTVSIPGKHFSPSHLTVVVGDEVTWRNADLLDHDVQAVDGSFGSGVLGRFGSFTVGFVAAGSDPYVCTIHPFMRGQVDALAAVLRGPGGAVLAGEPVRLEGRSAPGAAVTLEQAAGDGAWRPVATAVAGGDGTFEFSLRVVEGSIYRAVTAAGASPEIGLAVTARVSARIAVHHGHRRTHVWVRTTPRSPGLTAVLQRYSRERFMWRRLAHARLDSRGRASFAVRASRGGRVRVLLARSARGAALAVSDVARLRDGRHVGDPATPHDAPAPGHGHP